MLAACGRVSPEREYDTTYAKRERSGSQAPQGCERITSARLARSQPGSHERDTQKAGNDGDSAIATSAATASLKSIEESTSGWMHDVTAAASDLMPIVIATNARTAPQAPSTRPSIMTSRTMRGRPAPTRGSSSR
jgi:hypothetical protein